MNIEDILPLLSPEARAFVIQAITAGDQETINAILEMVTSAPDIQAGVAQLEAAVAEFLQTQGGGPLPQSGAEGGMLPPTEAMLPGAGLPPELLAQLAAMLGGPPGAGAVVPPPGIPDGIPEGIPGLPPGLGAPPPGPPVGMPPEMMAAMAGGAPPPPPPVGVAPPPPPAEPPKPKPKPKIPPYVPPPVPELAAPTYEQVKEDARLGRIHWQPRDQRIREDWDLYHLVYDKAKLGDGPIAEDGTSVIHKRTQPATFVDRVTGLVTPRNDKITIEIEPRSDTDEYREAAQNSEDAILSWRELDEEWWLENRIGEPPLPRKEAALATVEGGFGWCFYVNPKDTAHPFQYEVVPLSQLYDIGHACTRQLVLPLHQARARYPKIKEDYPIEGKLDAKNGGGWWNANQEIRIIIHADNSGVWKSMAYEETGSTASNGGGTMVGPTSGIVGQGKRGDWIEEPRRINYGFRYFSYVVWGGSAGEAMMATDRDRLVALKGFGVLTMLRKTFMLMDLFISALATGALTAVDPPTVTQIPEGVNPLKIKKIDRRPGGDTVVPQGTVVNPLRWDVSGSSDAQNTLNSLIAELQDVASPAMAGQPGASGFAQMISNEQASSLVVAPMIDALEKWYALMHKQRLILALRYSTDEKYNKGADGKPQTYFNDYAKRSFRGESWGQYGTLTPKDIERSGVRVIARYHDRNMQEEMALSNMASQLVNAHLMSQETALRRMGVRDPKREQQKIFTDGALQDTNVLKAVMETAVYNSGNKDLINAWDKAFYADMVSGKNGSEPKQTGQPSMPAQPGSNMGNAPAVLGG